MTFSGTRASELNALLQTSANVVVDIAAKEILLDETIRVPSNVSIEGNGVIVNGEANITPMQSYWKTPRMLQSRECGFLAALSREFISFAQTKC